MFYLCGPGWRARYRAGGNPSKLFQRLSRYPEASTPSEARVLFVNVLKESKEEFWRVVQSRHVRVFIASEAVFTNFNVFDFGIGFDHLDFGDRHLRLHPSYQFSDAFPPGLVSKASAVAGALAFPDRGFCDFIYSNKHAHPMRDDLYRALNNFQKVESLGGHNPLSAKNFRSIGQLLSHQTDANRMQEKIELQSRFRFSITAENARYGGYTSEKLLSSLIAGQVPIYWGNPLVSRDFNPDRFIEVEKFPDLGAMVDYVRALDNDQNAWEAIASAPWYTPDQLDNLLSSEAQLDNFLANIFSLSPSTPARRGIGTYPDLIEAEERRLAPNAAERFFSGFLGLLRLVLVRLLDSARCRLILSSHRKSAR